MELSHTHGRGLSNHAARLAQRKIIAQPQVFLHREYLVNIVSGRRTAQKRVTGGRWRRIVLGELGGQGSQRYMARPRYRSL